MTKRLPVMKTQVQGLVLMSLVIGLGTACGRSDMLWEPGEATPGAGGAAGLSPDAGVSSSQGSGGAQPLAGSSATLGGAGVGGASLVASAGVGGASSRVSTGGSKPTGGTSSSMVGSKGGASAVTSMGGTKPMGGSSTVVGSGGVVGGAVVGGSKASGVVGGAVVGGSKASGGASATGGTTGTVICAESKACGGDVVGTWNVTSSCLNVSGQVDLSMFGLGCRRVAAEGALRVSGDWIARADSGYTDKTTTTGKVQYALPSSCLNVSGTTVGCLAIPTLLAGLGESNVTCVDAKGGGCTCTATVNQVGSAGVLSLSPSTSGTYKTSGNSLVLDGDTRYGYCASGSQLTLSPQGTLVPTTGTIVFQKP